MSLGIKEIAQALQLILLRVIYEHFAVIVAYARQKTIENGAPYDIVNFTRLVNGLVVRMVHIGRGRYEIQFKNVPYPMGLRSFTIKLGSGKNLVNHRVLNEVGVRLNAFLDDREFQDSSDYLVEYGRSWVNARFLENKKLGFWPKVAMFFIRIVGKKIFDFDGFIDQFELPFVKVKHSVTVSGLEDMISTELVLELPCGVKQTLVKL